MDTDRAITSPWNKIHEVASSQKGPNLSMSWYFVWFFSLSLDLPTQGSLATTIVSGRAYLTDVPLPCDDTARFMASAFSAGLCLDTPGRARLTGLPTSGLNAVQQVNWAHNLSGSLLPTRLHQMLASGACSCRATTPGLLLTVNDRFKLQPLAKYMYSLERQSTTFLPPLSMTPANPYDFPQKSLAQESPTGVCSPKLCSLSGPWCVTSTLTPWTDLGVSAIRPGLPSEWQLMRREMQWYTLGLQCWITRLTAWLYTVRKRDTFQSSLACSPDWSVLTVSMQGSGPGSPLHAMLTSVCTPRPPPVQCLLSWGPSVRFSLPTPLAAFAWPSRFCFSSCCSAAVLAPFDLASAVSPSLRPRFEASSPGVRGSAATALCFWRTTALPRSRQPSPAPWNRLRSPYYAHARRAASPLRWLEVSSLATVTPLKPFFYPWRPWLGSCPILGVPSASVVMLAYRATHGWMQNCLALLGSEGHFIPSSPSLLLLTWESAAERRGQGLVEEWRMVHPMTFAGSWTGRLKRFWRRLSKRPRVEEYTMTAEEVAAETRGPPPPVPVNAPSLRQKDIVHVGPPPPEVHYKHPPPGTPSSAAPKAKATPRPGMVASSVWPVVAPSSHGGGSAASDRAAVHRHSSDLDDYATAQAV